ncbi:Cwf19-like C-terminal domain-containing protein [Plasmodiophora brassicae]
MLSGIRIGKKAATASAPSPPDPPQQREQWMTGAFDRPATAGKRAADAPEPESAPRMKRPVDLSAAGVRPTKVVGDGGASWRRRMERRARERDSAASSDMSSHPLSINQGAVPAAPVRSRRSPERDPRRHDRAASSQRPSETTVDVDLNQLAAKAMRAKIAGNMAEHDRLQAEIDAARSRPRVEIVPDLDTRDRPTNLPARDADGIKAMVQEERMQSYADYQMQSAMAVVRDRRYAASTDDQFDAADESRFVSKDDKAKGRKPLNQRQPNENCWYCLGGPRFQHHLVVRVGKYCHIEVPSGPPLGLGHCLIVPNEHTASSTSMNDSVFAELQAIKDRLVTMFASESLGVVFLETSLPNSKRHCMIDCITLVRELYDEAPIYFKKALLESDEEWSSHKKVIVTSRCRGIRSAIPGGFPYFHVEFGDDRSGFAHVIEDESKFSKDFGREIVCGLLEEPASIVLRAKNEPRELQSRRVDQLKEMLQPYDWTTNQTD